MKAISLALMFVGVCCTGNPLLALACIVAGGILGWRAGLFEPLA